jgi:hypothetical protein
MNLKEMFSNQLKELMASAHDSSLIKEIEKELQDRFETLDFMYSQI